MFRLNDNKLTAVRRDMFAGVKELQILRFTRQALTLCLLGVGIGSYLALVAPTTQKRDPHC